MKRIKKIIQMVNTCLDKISFDNVGAYSAQASFFIVISFFPFLMFLLTLVQYLPITESIMQTTMSSLFPDFINSFIGSIISEIYSKATGTIISVTVITALWSASRGFLSIVRGLNAVYSIRETRNYFVVRAISALYTLVFAAVIILTLGLLVFGNRLYMWINTKLPFLNDFALLLISFRTLLGMCILTLFFLALYVVIPNRKSRILNELPGALLSAAGWMLFSYIYSMYIDHMGNYSYMYGSLTAIVLLMLWLYFCMYILFLGAEVNLFLQKHRHPVQYLKSLLSLK